MDVRILVNFVWARIEKSEKVVGEKLVGRQYDGI